MMKAIWNGAVIAESEVTVPVEGNHYFPMSSIKEEYFQKTATTTVCGWKGTANYFDVVVDGQTNSDACWYYSDPSHAAKGIKDHVAFWKGVEVVS